MKPSLIGVYRKPTHTDLYLPWDRYHNLPAKYSVIKTLLHRAQTICSTPQLFKDELQHLEKVLMLCKYPKWTINKIFHQEQEKKEGKEKKQTLPSKYPARMCHIVVSYVQDIYESLKNICVLCMAVPLYLCFLLLGLSRGSVSHILLFIVCIVIHNCSSLGSLVFMTLR